MSRRTMSAIGTVLSIAVLVAACSTPEGAVPSDDGTAFGEAGEIGVLPDMTATECAVAGSPWRIDDLQFDRDWSNAMIASDPEVASGGLGGGDYTLALSADGGLFLSTAGYGTTTTLKTFDGETGFGHISTLAQPGDATAEWAEASDDGATVTFIDWDSTISESAPVLDDGTPYAGALPAWQLPGRSGAVLECDTDGTGLWVRSVTPGYLDLHFLR